MRIEQEQQGGVEILALTGQLAGHTGGLDLRERLDVLLWEDEPAVIVDLTDVARIDSGFVGHLLACHTSLTREGGRFAIVARGLPLEVLRLAKLDELFEVHETRERALAGVTR